MQMTQRYTAGDIDGESMEFSINHELQHVPDWLQVNRLALDWLALQLKFGSVCI